MSQIMLEDTDSQLARLVQQVSIGDEVIILRDSTPVAKIVALPCVQPISQFGNAKDDLIYMADDFDAPMEDFKDYMQWLFCWIRTQSCGTPSATPD